MKKRLSIIFLILFILITILYILNITNNIDLNILNYFVSIRTNKLNDIMNYITFLGSTKCIVTILILLTLFNIKNIKIYLLDITMILEIIINNIIKIIIKRPRINYYNLVIEKSYSYPSGHIMSSIILYGYLIYLINNLNINKYIKLLLTIILILITILIFISRLYLGAHYFIDCISSLFLGLSILFIVLYIKEKKIC